MSDFTTAAAKSQHLVLTSKKKSPPTAAACLSTSDAVSDSFISSQNDLKCQWLRWNAA